MGGPNALWHTQPEFWVGHPAASHAFKVFKKTFRTEVLITAVFPSLPPTAYSAAFGAESHSAVEFDTIASIVTAQILITIVL